MSLLLFQQFHSLESVLVEEIKFPISQMTRISLGAQMAILLAFSACMGWCTGCGPVGPPTGSVSGRVTYNGQPLATGVVTFINEKTGSGASSDLDSSGSYHIESIRTGKYNVAVHRHPAIPGEVPLSGSCGGIQLLGREDAQVRQKWRSSSGVWSNRVGEGCQIFTSHAAPNASFKHFGAYVERNVAADHEKIARGCEEDGLKELSPDGVMRRWELASPWPSRRG